MLKISLLILFSFIILLIFFSGCVSSVNCEDFCSNQKHAQCIGKFNISGEYPNCKCKYVCDVNLTKS